MRPPPRSAVLPHRFATGETKTAALFILPIAKRWGGGPRNAVEGPRGSAENTAATLADLNMSHDFRRLVSERVSSENRFPPFGTRSSVASPGSNMLGIWQLPCALYTNPAANIASARNSAIPNPFSDEVTATRGNAAGRFAIAFSVASATAAASAGLILSALVRTIW